VERNKGVVILPLTLHQPRKSASLHEAPLPLGETDRRLEVGEVRYGGPVGTRQAMARAETVTCRTVPQQSGGAQTQPALKRNQPTGSGRRSFHAAARRTPEAPA
jgi:hypothetical protein